MFINFFFLISVGGFFVPRLICRGQRANLYMDSGFKSGYQTCTLHTEPFLSALNYLIFNQREMKMNTFPDLFLNVSLLQYGDITKELL